MPTDDWSDQFQELFDRTPGTDALEDHERSYVESLFEAGFTYSAEDYDAMGLDPDQVFNYREEFFQYMGLDDTDFDWEGWREAMGYE
jgi:hypothetical protein